VRFHIENERSKLGSYKCMLTFTEKNCEGDLGGSPGFGWTERPKINNILLVKWGVTIYISRSGMRKNKRIKKRLPRIHWAPFSTHLVLLKRFRRDDSNHTLKDYQTRL